MRRMLRMSSGKLDIACIRGNKWYNILFSFLHKPMIWCLQTSMYRHGQQGLIRICLCMLFFSFQRFCAHWLALYDWQTATVWVKNLRLCSTEKNWMPWESTQIISNFPFWVNHPFNSDLMLTSQRKPLLHSRGCCRPAPGTCERTEGRRAGTAPLGDSPAQTRWSSSGRCSTPYTERDPPADCTLTAPYWHPAADGHLLLQQTTCMGAVMLLWLSGRTLR